MYLAEQGKIMINGVPQFVAIRAEKEGAPLLLYLHGGPGDAALPLVMKHNRALEAEFTLVVWEQRGAGKSYYKLDGPVTIDLFIQDLYELTQYLLSRFRERSLYLVGHSWGSVLGLRFLKRYPELVRAYIGCGQVVHMKKSCRAAYDFALEHAEGKDLARLRGIDCTYTAEGWLEELLFVTGQVVKHKGSLYGRSSYNDLVRPFLFSRYYSLADLIRRQKGGMQALRHLWPELMQTDLEGETRYGAPVIFVEGRHDRHVSSALARECYDRIETEKRFYWFDFSCHFPQWSESGRFHEVLFDLLKEAEL